MKLSRSKPAPITAGASAEQFAGEYLASLGMAIVVTNYRARYGEIDLIARDNDTLVFVEVRLRNHGHFGSGAESVNASKQQKLIRTAQDYLTKHHPQPPPCRFDVISLAAALDKKAPYHVEWVRDAFRPDY
jgi:putative endonuclease